MVVAGVVRDRGGQFVGDGVADSRHIAVDALGAFHDLLIHGRLGGLVVDLAKSLASNGLAIDGRTVQHRDGYDGIARIRGNIEYRVDAGGHALGGGVAVFGHGHLVGIHKRALDRRLVRQLGQEVTQLAGIWRSAGVEQMLHDPHHRVGSGILSIVADTRFIQRGINCRSIAAIRQIIAGDIRAVGLRRGIRGQLNGIQVLAGKHAIGRLDGQGLIGRDIGSVDRGIRSHSGARESHAGQQRRGRGHACQKAFGNRVHGDLFFPGWLLVGYVRGEICYRRMAAAHRRACTAVARRSLPSERSSMMPTTPMPRPSRIARSAPPLEPVMGIWRQIFVLAITVSPSEVV